jgi:hypothetical protein
MTWQTQSKRLVSQLREIEKFPMGPQAPILGGPAT